MGVDIALMRFFDQAAQESRIDGPMLALGSLTIRETPEAISAYAASNGYSKLAASHTVGDLFGERYGVTDYKSCDLNGAADIMLDLSQPLPADHRGAYGSILNGGTVEHIFDLRQVMQNIHDATRAGGLILHNLPLTWIDHGLINLNPVMFHLLAEANRYEIAAEGYYFSAGTWPGQEKPIVTLVGIDERVPVIDRTHQEIFQSRHVPSLVMHLIALRKTSDAPFQVPLQVSD